MSVISGVAERYDGLPVDYVSIFNWSDGKCIAQVVPDALGNWSFIYNKDLNCGITYVADGCEPLTHGAYVFVAEWSPIAFFDGIVKGVYYDPSDLSTMFQDSNGLVPVTAHGQPVGMIKDLSGNGFHALQTTPNARPLYQTDGVLHWLSFDGVDDYLVSDYQVQSPQHLMTTSVKMQNIATQQGVLECFGDTSSETSDYKKGCRILRLNSGYLHQIGDGENRYTTSQPYPNSNAVALIVRVDNKNVDFLANDELVSSNHAASMSPGSKTYIGQNSSLAWPADMKFYSALILERTISEVELTKIDSYMTGIAGITN